MKPYYEELPPDCPPEEAFFPAADFFRLGSLPPQDSDFWSHRRKFPDKEFQVSECVARSVSVFDDLEEVRLLKHRHPTMRSKPIFQVDLTEQGGVVAQTGKNAHHFSWWRSLQFDPSSIKILEP